MLRLLQQLRDLEIEGIAHVVAQGQLLLPHLLPARGIVIPQGRRLREGNVLIQFQVFQGGHPIAVRGFVVDHQAERMSVILVGIQPGQRMVCHDFCRISGLRDILPVGFLRPHDRIVVFPLVPEDVVVVESFGPCAQVPFPNHGSPVSHPLQQFREKGDRRIHDPVLERPLAVVMAVHTGHQGCPGRC